MTKESPIPAPEEGKDEKLSRRIFLTKSIPAAVAAMTVIGSTESVEGAEDKERLKTVLKLQRELETYRNQFNTADLSRLSEHSLISLRNSVWKFIDKIWIKDNSNKAPIPKRQKNIEKDLLAGVNFVLGESHLFLTEEFLIKGGLSEKGTTNIIRNTVHPIINHWKKFNLID